MPPNCSCGCIASGCLQAASSMGPGGCILSVIRQLHARRPRVLQSSWVRTFATRVRQGDYWYVQFELTACNKDHLCRQPCPCRQWLAKDLSQRPVALSQVQPLTRSADLVLRHQTPEIWRNLDNMNMPRSALCFSK